MGEFWDALIIDGIGNTFSESYWRAIERRHNRMFGSAEYSAVADEKKDSDTGEKTPSPEAHEISDLMVGIVTGFRKNLAESLGMGNSPIFGCRLSKPDSDDKMIHRHSAFGSLMEDFTSAVNDAKEKEDSLPEAFYQQMTQLAGDLHDYLSEFLEETADRYGEEEIFSDYEELPEPNVSDYGSGGYDYVRLSQAKVACKEAMTRAVNDMRESYAAGRDWAAEQGRQFLARMGKDIQKFSEEYQESFDDYVSLYCEGEAKAYAMESREELTGIGKVAKWYPAEKIKGQFAAILREEFEEKAQSLWAVKAYFSKCDYDGQEERYCYEMDDALYALYDAAGGSLKAAFAKTEQRMQELYMAVLDELADDLSTGLIGLVRISEKEHVQGTNYGMEDAK